MELAPEKRQLLTQQQNERTKLLARLDSLTAEYRKELEYYRRQARGHAFAHEITRSHSYHDERTFWEYLHTIIEPFYLFTWRKAKTSACTRSYQRKRRSLERDLSDIETQHRKERIGLRYDKPVDFPNPRPNVHLQSSDDSSLLPQTDQGDTTTLANKTTFSVSPRFLPKAPA